MTPLLPQDICDPVSKGDGQAFLKRCGGMLRLLAIMLEDVCIIKPFHDYFSLPGAMAYRPGLTS
jgi:hypothetical protein